ncbi:MAG: hypothetical protein ACHQDD_11040 [Steroidobacterales bacterium]
MSIARRSGTRPSTPLSGTPHGRSSDWIAIAPDSWTASTADATLAQAAAMAQQLRRD